MIKTSRQLKDKIRNLSKEKNTEPYILMRSYMMERFLERLSISPYQQKFILKGGMLVASTVGIESRSTMDIYATAKGMNLSPVLKKINVNIIRIFCQTIAFYFEIW